MRFAESQAEYERYVEWAFSSFENFMAVTMEWLCENDPLSWGPPTRWQRIAARHIEYGGDSVALGAHRGFAKTSIGGMFIPYNLKRNNNLRFRVVGPGDDAASDITKFAQDIIAGLDIVSDLNPGENQRRSSKKFDVAGAAASLNPSVSGFGIFSAIQGKRPDFLWIDDIEGPNTIDSVTTKERLHRRRIELENLASRKCRRIVVFTYHCEDSEYLSLEDEGYNVMLIPQRYPNRELLEKYGKKLPKEMIEDIERDPSLMTGGGIEGDLGKPICPELFPEEVCQKKELMVGKTQYRLHYLLDTSPFGEDAYPLKCRDLIVDDVDPRRAPSYFVFRREKVATDVPCVGFKGDNYYYPAERGPSREYATITGAIDPSGRQAGGDETTMAIAGILNSHYHFMEIDGYPGGYEPEKFDSILWRMAEFDVRTILVEENGLGSAWGEILKGRLPAIRIEAMKRFPLLHREPWRVAIVPILSKGRKELRLANTLEPVANSHRIIIDKRILQREHRNRSEGRRENSLRFLFAYQWTRLTRDVGCLANDDRLEPVEFIIRYHERELAKDVNQQIEMRKMEDAHAAAREWLAAKRARERKPQYQRKLVHWLEPLRPDHYIP